ncbi:MAG: hypothetical protein LM550_15760 [Candidatus Contendobacter sp.]|jgi:Tfp pilus assembly PilM family ATPase|nr:hypothetical protein [Gammaproteobacteria bacterium]MCC8995107.1 hypothetical protein [Candidatus Contendobacter sp.]
MTEEEQNASVLIAACAKEASGYILSCAEQAGLDRLAFLLNVSAVLAASALAAQPQDQLAAASQHIQDALGLVHCREEADPARH